MNYNLIKKLGKEEIAILRKEFFEANKIYGETLLEHEKTLEEINTQKKILKKIKKLKENINETVNEIALMTKSAEGAIKHNDPSLNEDGHERMEMIHENIKENKKEIEEIKKEIEKLKQENKKELKIAKYMETQLEHMKTFLEKTQQLLKLN